MRRFTIVFASVLACVCLLLVHSAQAEKTFACQPGASYTFKGTAPANTALLLFFDGRPVGGTTSDGSGTYRVRLTIGQETPGAYPIAVQVRESHQIVTSATCIIPVPGTAVGAAVGGVGGTAPSATPNGQRGVQPTATRGKTQTATSSLTPNTSTTATAQTRSTATGTVATATGTIATATVTSTGTQLTATTTATGATATASPTGSTTATRSPTVTTTDSSDEEPTLDIDWDESPEAGKDFILHGSVADSDDNALPNVAVTVTFSVDDGASSPWCTATTDANGNWTCTRTIDTGLKDKDVTWTMTVSLNGKTYTEDNGDSPQ